MKIKITDNTKDYIKWLKKKHGALEIVSAETVNETAKIVKREYEKDIKKFTIRNKFTLGAIKLLPATAMRKSGDFRKIEKINAVVGVRKMKGGKDHYLKKQEFGAAVKGSAKTGGAVPVPLDAARTSGSKKRPVKGPLRLQNTTPQTLMLDGQPFGTKSDRFSPRQRWALLYKYTGRSGSGRPKGRDQGWNIKKPFFFQGLKSGFGIFNLQGSRFKKVRTLEKKSVQIKARHKLEKAGDKITQRTMSGIFKRAASRFMR